MNRLIDRQVSIDALDMAIERYDEMAEEYQKKPILNGMTIWT